jgi:hypothetical protein
MGVTKSFDLYAAISVEKCFLLLREVGSTVKGYRLENVVPCMQLTWKKPSGISPWRKVTAKIQSTPTNHTQVTFIYESTGLFDPLNYAVQTTALFINPFKQKLSQIQPQLEKPIAQTQQSLSVADELRKLAQLKTEGFLSEEEFNNEKAKLLGR